MGVPVKNYEHFYTVDEEGNIYSLRKNKILKPSITNNGYLTVELFNETRSSKRLLIHRIVAETFIPNPQRFKQVNHKDENKRNNNVNNLEWCSAKYNMNYGTAKERRKQSREWYRTSEKSKIIARKNGSVVSKKVVQIDKSGNILHIYNSAKQASNITGLSHSHILECCAGKRYKTVGGYIWKYYERM